MVRMPTEIVAYASVISASFGSSESTPAVREHDLRYSEFIHGLKKANIELDRKTLSEMAINDKAAFKNICDRVKETLAA